MQRVLIIPEGEFEQLLQRMEAIEHSLQEKQTPEEVYTARQAAAHLRITVQAILKARRQKRLTGFLINEKEWGFHLSELERYNKRYRRYQK
jgi:hypothetical protein